VFLLSLCIFQHAQASSNFSPNREETSQIDLIRTNALNQLLYITVAHLNDFNRPILDSNGNIEKCYYGDTFYGCGEGGSGYPYDQNPLWIDVENEYLLDVLPREMNVKENFYTLASLQAQAIAARSYADYRDRLSGDMNNSVEFQIFIPNAYELYHPPSKALVYEAVTSTQGLFLSHVGSSIDAQFASDSILRTAKCLNDDFTQCYSYLVRVDDPISGWNLTNPACDAKNNGNLTMDDPDTPDWIDVGKVWGMSQKGAIRWSLGNQCAISGVSTNPWPITWNDYRQILVHYYTGIDIVDDNTGNKIAPDHRWNLLNHDIPKEMQLGVTYNTLSIQNTSIVDWNEGDISLGWTLSPPCRTADSVPESSWNVVTLPAATKGHPPVELPLTIRPNRTGMLMLHIDLKRNSTNTWFRHGQPGGWPYVQIPIWVQPLSAPVNPQAGLYPYGISGCYYNDEYAPYALNEPITWHTFTNYAASRYNRKIDFSTGSNPPVPGINGTFWSAKWIGKLYVADSGNYTFYLTGLDDGGRIYIDKIADGDTPILESWLVQGPTDYTSEPIYLEAGRHDFRVDYAQGPANMAQLTLEWASPSMSRRVIEALSPLPATVTIFGNAGIAGALLHYIDGTGKTVTADSNGDYTLVVPFGWSGTVTPALPGYKFAPDSITYDGVYDDQMSLTPDFIPTPVPVMTVTHLGDTNDGACDAHCSLREAIAAAEDGATIVFAQALSGGTIRVDLGWSLVLSKPVTIDGSSLAAPITISGANASGVPTYQVFSVNPGVNATLKNLNVTLGKRGIYIYGGTLTVWNCVFSNNIAPANSGGGAIYNNHYNNNPGSLTVINSTFSNNTAPANLSGPGFGGAIYNNDSTTLVVGSTFSNNTASNGGAIDSTGLTSALAIGSSTFTGNTANGSSGQGGAIRAASSPVLGEASRLTIINSTFDSNTATSTGGGLRVSVKTARVINSTFSGNGAVDGGGILFDRNLSLENTILANSVSGADCYSWGLALADNLNNLVEDGSCSPALSGDPLLGPLAENGGPTRTLALLPGSPAIDAGDDAACSSLPVSGLDQRGAARPQGERCDIGAYEYTASAQVILSGNTRVGGTTLTYNDGGTQTVTADGSGNYSLMVPPGWSGTVTPSKAGHVFSPPSRTYTEVQASLSSQDYWPTFPASWSGAVRIVSAQPVIAISRLHLGSEVMTYNGFGSGGMKMYVPMLFKNAYSGYQAALNIQNTDLLGSAAVNIKYYDSTGSPTCEDNFPIARLGVQSLWLPNVTCLPNNDNGWVGGAVITADRPVAAVGRPHIGSQVTTYAGFSSGSTTMYLPMLFKGAFGGTYNAAFYVQNTAAYQTADITIKYYDSNGNLTCTMPIDTLAPLASKGYWLPSIDCLPPSWVGGAVVTATQDVVAIGRPHIGEQVTTYNAFSGGAASQRAPMLFKNAFGGTYNAALYIQNTSASQAATLQINYFDANGNLSCTVPDTLAPLASKGYWLPSIDCLPAGWVGGAVVSANTNIVVLGRPHVGAEVMTYGGVSGGSNSFYLPMLYRNFSGLGGTYNSAMYLQNTNTVNESSVEFLFLDESGSLHCAKTVILPAGATVGYWLPSLSCTP
jgi:CSLREA domain-containing protein